MNDNNNGIPINSVVFYKSYYDSIVLMEKEKQLEIYNTIFNYSFNGIISNDLSNEVKSVFLLMKPTLDSSIKRYKTSVENGKKGGRPKKETQEKPKKTQEKPIKNLNYNKDYNKDLNKEYNKAVNNEELDTLYDN